MTTPRRHAVRPGLVVGFIVMGNLAGLVAYALLRAPRAATEVVAADSERVVAAPEPAAVPGHVLRAAGLAALGAGRFDEAVSRFTEAAQASGETPDVPQLIKIAADLRDQGFAATPPPDPRDRRARVGQGALVVASTPPNLELLVDGAGAMATPARQDLAAGEHTIALRANQTVLHKSVINIEPGRVVTVDQDLTVALAAASAAATTPAVLELGPGTLYAVAHTSLGLRSITRAQLSDVFLARELELNGHKVQRLLRQHGDPAEAAFLKRVVRMNPRALREALRRGERKASKPLVVAGIEEVAEAVKNRPGALGFALGSELKHRSDLTAIEIR